ncbi:MAG: DUF4446 family protein [Candidatus Paceibacterota bacterium]
MFPFKNKKAKPKIQTLEEAIRHINSLEDKLEKLEADFKDREEKSKLFFQRFGLIRYSPFNEVGGNQSFSLAMLDENNNGFVLTSMYTKEGNRFFAKLVEKGASKYQLSEEEKEAIKQVKK